MKKRLRIACASENQERLEPNGAADDVNLLSENTNTNSKNTKAPLEGGQRISLEVDAEESLVTGVEDETLTQR
jgi:type V secretory pathway adhesin AidA